MAIVQISFQDNADNETGFKIYKGTTSPLSSGSDLLATVDLVSATWTPAEGSVGSAPSLQLTSNNNTDASTTGETFVITYDEQDAGSYFYGVSATNSVGDSSVITTGSALTVS